MLKKYNRRHLPVMTPRRLEKSTDGFTAGSCMSPDDPRRGTVEVRPCKTYADATACPAGSKTALTPVYMGFNFGRFCDEYSIQCVRSEYPTDDAALLKCCTGQTSEAECDPRYCPQSQNCRDFMIGKCDTDANFLSADCQAWLGRAGNEDVKENIMRSRCKADMMYGDTPCRKFCLDNDGKCDSEMTKYCSLPRCADWAMWSWADQATPADLVGANAQYKACRKDYGAKDPICSCINSDLKTLNQTLAPVPCFDQKCVATGYQTNDMARISAKCPSYVDCRAVMVSGDKATIQSSYIQQNCGAEFKSIEDARLKALADEEAKRLRDDEARNKPVTTQSSEPVADDAEPPSTKFADVAGLGPIGHSLFGEMTVGGILFIFIILIIVLAISYMAWTRKKARELAALEASMAMADQQIEQNTTGAAEAQRMSEIRGMIADLPPVGAMP